MLLIVGFVVVGFYGLSDIEPAAGQRTMAIAQRHASLSFLDIDDLPLYMYMKGQWTPSAPF